VVFFLLGLANGVVIGFVSKSIKRIRYPVELSVLPKLANNSVISWFVAYKHNDILDIDYMWFNIR
jgi:hypothetical protein